MTKFFSIGCADSGLVDGMILNPITTSDYDPLKPFAGRYMIIADGEDDYSVDTSYRAAEKICRLTGNKVETRVYASEEDAAGDFRDYNPDVVLISAEILDVDGLIRDLKRLDGEL